MERLNMWLVLTVFAVAFSNGQVCRKSEIFALECSSGYVTPANCLEVLSYDPNATDREYNLDIGGTPRTIYCHNMTSGNPTEFITLHEENKFEWRDGVQMTYKATYFTKVAVDLQNMVVLQNDFSFTRTTFESYHASADNASVGFGEVNNCACDWNFIGFAHIDLRGTGFSMTANLIWEPYGWQAHIKTDRSWQTSDYLQFHYACGGCCGGCHARGLEFVVSPETPTSVGKNTTGISCTIKVSESAYLTTAEESSNIDSCYTFGNFNRFGPILNIFLNCPTTSVQLVTEGGTCKLRDSGPSLTDGWYLAEVLEDKGKYADDASYLLSATTPNLSAVGNKCVITQTLKKSNVSTVHIMVYLSHRYNSNLSLKICSSGIRFECLGP